MATRINRSQNTKRTTGVKENQQVDKDVNVASLDDIARQDGVRDRLGGRGSAGAELIANLQETGAVAPAVGEAIGAVFAKVREGLSERFGVQLFELDALMADATESAHDLLSHVHGPLSRAVEASEDQTTSITEPLGFGMEAARAARAILRAAQQNPEVILDMGWPTMGVGRVDDAIKFLGSDDKIGELRSIWQGISDAVTTGIDDIKKLAKARARLGDAVDSMKKGDKVTLYGAAKASDELAIAGRAAVEIERLNEGEPARYAVRHSADIGVGVGGKRGELEGAARAHGLVEFVQVVEGGENALKTAKSVLAGDAEDLETLVQNGLPEGIVSGGRLKANLAFGPFASAGSLTQKTAVTLKDGKLTGHEQVFSLKEETSIEGKAEPLSTTLFAKQYELSVKVGQKDGETVAEAKLSMEMVLDGRAQEISFEFDFMKLSAEDKEAIYQAAQSGDVASVGQALAAIAGGVDATLKTYDKRDVALSLDLGVASAEVGIETNLGTKERPLKFPFSNLRAMVTQQQGLREAVPADAATPVSTKAAPQPSHHLEHVVTKGDTISRILQDLDIEPTKENIAQFVAMNQNAWGRRPIDADKIVPGMKFVLPDIRPGQLEEVSASTPRQVGDGVTAMNQGDYKNYRLGKSKRSIAASGCFITSLAMVASKLVGGDIDPAKANALILKGDGFSGASIYAPKASKALGLKMDARKKYSPAMRAKLDRALAEGRPAVVGVDYKRGHSSGFSDADHFLTITGKNADGSYRAIDPAGGKAITLRPNAHGDLVAKVGKKNYRVAEVAIFSRAKDTLVA